MLSGIDARPQKKRRTIVTADCSVGSVGLSGGSDGTTPTTKFNLTADKVTTQDRFGNTKTYLNVSGSVDIAVVAQVGGRDQATAFAAFAEPNFFWVPNGAGSLGLVASLNGINTPPNGHNEWQCAVNAKLNGGAQIIQGTVSGSKFTPAVPISVVASGGGTFPVTASTSNYVPAAALEIELSMFYSSTTSAGGIGSGNAVVGLGSQDYLLMPFYINGASQNTGSGGTVSLPQTSSRSITYGSAALSGNVATFVQTIRVNRYTMKNGAR